VAKHCAEANKTYCLNLSAPFLIQFFRDQMMSVLPYADIVFGNETEAATFAEVHGLPDTKDVRAVALHLAGLPKANAGRPRTVIITQGGAAPVLVVSGPEHQVAEFDVVRLAPEQIVDTNGAGDAFVGGFLAQYVQGAPLEVAVKCGIWAATLIIQRSGCTHPDVMDFSAA
jgi:adenosine kinase